MNTMKHRLMALVLAMIMLVGMTPVNAFAEGEEQPEKWQDIDLPTEVYGLAKQLDQQVTEKELKEAFLKAIENKLPEGVSKKDITVTIDQNTLEEANNRFISQKSLKESGYRTVKGTYTYNGNKSKDIEARVLFYALPFWGLGQGNQISTGNGFHNFHKITPKDVSNPTIDASQQKKIKDTFISINKANNKQNNDGFTFSEKDVTVDNQGNITVTYANGHTFTISKTHTVSVFPEIEDVILFSKQGENGKWTTHNEYNKSYKLRDGEQLQDFRILQNIENQDVNANNSDGDNMPYEGNLFDMHIKYDQGTNSIVIKGPMNFTSKAAAFNKYVKVNLENKQGNNLYRDFTRRIAFRTIGTTEPDTIFQELTEDTKFTKDQLKAELKKVKENATVGTTGDDNATTDPVKQGKGRDTVKEDIKNKIEVELTDTEFDKIEDNTKKLQTIKGKLTYGNQASAPINLKLRYYTKDFKVLVNDPNKLTTTDIDAIKKTAAEANGVSEDKVTVDNTGNVTVTFKDGDKDKPIDLGTGHTYTLTPSYTDARVAPGNTVELPLVLEQGQSLPKDTTFSLPKNPPNGLSVDQNTGKLTYTAPANQEDGPVTGIVLMTIPGQTTPKEITYTINVKKDTPNVTPKQLQNGDWELVVKDAGDKPYPNGSTVAIKIDDNTILNGQVNQDGKVIIKNELLPKEAQDNKHLTALHSSAISNPVKVKVPAKQVIPVQTIEVNKGTDARTIVAKNGLGEFKNLNNVKTIVFTETPVTNEVTKGQIPTYKATITFNDGSTSEVQIPVKVKAVCPTPEDLTKQNEAFLTAAKEKFEGIKSKEGIFHAKYDEKSKQVAVLILDKEKSIKEVKDTGIITGLFDLKQNHGLSAIKIGSQDKLDLSGVTESNQMAQIVLMQIGTELNVQGVTSLKTLGAFVDKSITLKAYIGDPDCTQEEVTFTIKGLEFKAPRLTKVVDKTNLTDPEKALVKEAIKAANKDFPLTDQDITVEANGKTTIKDGKTILKILEPKETVIQLPVKTKVTDPTSLTLEEQGKIKEAIKKANPDFDLTDNDIDVTTTGQAKVKKDGKDLTNFEPKETIDQPIPTPTITQPTEGDKTLTGKGQPGAEIQVTIPGLKDPLTGTVGKDGNWKIDLPEKVQLKKGQDITITQHIDKKEVGQAKTTVKGKDAPEKPSPASPAITWDGYWYLGNNLGSTEKPSEPSKPAEELETGRHERYLYGYVDKTVRPEGMITRSEAAAMIARLAKLDRSDQSKPNFKDTPSHWYNGAINAMVKKDLMFADKNGNFRPNDPITRGEFARALFTIDKKSDKIAPFADVKGHIYEDAINQAYGNDRINGYPDGTFKPNAPIQRAEAAKILNKFADRNVGQRGLANVKADLIQFKDLKEGHWAYYEIVEAANTHDYRRVAKGSLEEIWLQVINDQVK